MDELNDLASHHRLDVLCVQECDSNAIPRAIGGLQLAAHTLTNRLGLALYYRHDRLESTETGVYSLRKSLHDRLMMPGHERLVTARLFDRETSTEMVVGSFHAAPLTASNRLRRKQIDAAHKHLNSQLSGIPTLLIGDYNYPWFQRRLRDRLEQQGVTLARPEEATYHRGRYFSGSFDFATTVGMHVDSAIALPRGQSDHRPILLLVRPTERLPST